MRIEGKGLKYRTKRMKKAVKGNLSKLSGIKGVGLHSGGIFL